MVAAWLNCHTTPPPYRFYQVYFKWNIPQAKVFSNVFTDQNNTEKIAPNKRCVCNELDPIVVVWWQRWRGADLCVCQKRLAAIRTNSGSMRHNGATVHSLHKHNIVNKKHNVSCQYRWLTFFLFRPPSSLVDLFFSDQILLLFFWAM